MNQKNKRMYQYGFYNFYTTPTPDMMPGDLEQYPDGYPDENYGGEFLTEDEFELFNRLLLSWREYLYWIRMAAVDIVNNLPSSEFTVNRLLEISGKISAIYGAVFGEDRGAEFSQLLNDNILDTIELIKAMTTNDPQLINNAELNYKLTADRIAQYYDSLGPVWESENWRDMLYGLMNGIKAMTNSLIKYDYQRSINQFDNLLDGQLDMINIVFAGIVEPVPEYY